MESAFAELEDDVYDAIEDPAVAAEFTELMKPPPLRRRL